MLEIAKLIIKILKINSSRANSITIINRNHSNSLITKIILI